jgi:hypothetical protein
VGKGRRLVVVSSLSRTLPAAAAVIIFSLALFGVYTNIYPVTDSNAHSAAKQVIPVLEPSGEESATKQSGDDTPTPTLLPTPAQSQFLEATETAMDPWMSERMEAAAKEPFIEEPKKLDEAANKDALPRDTFSQPANRPVDSILPKVEAPSLDNTTTSYENPIQPSTEPYTEVTPQQELPQAPLPDSPVGTETTSTQPPLDPPTGTETSPQTPPDSPPATGTSSQPPATGTSSQPPPDSPAGTGTLPPPPPPHAPPTSQLPANP